MEKTTPPDSLAILSDKLECFILKSETSLTYIPPPLYSEYDYVIFELVNKNMVRYYNTILDIF